MPPLPPKITFLKDTAKLNPLAAAMRGHRLRRPALRLGVRTGHARRRPLRPRAALPRARRRARRRRGRSTASTTSPRSTHQLKRGEFTQSFSLARNALLSTLPKVPHMTIRRRRNRHSSYYGKYRGTVVNNIDPMQIGRIQVMVPDVSAVIPTVVGDAVPARCPASTPASSPCRRSAPGVWVEFEQGDPDHPIWVGGYWGSAAEVPAMAKAVPPGVNGSRSRRRCRTASSISDVPGADRRHPDQTTTGAMISVSDVGHRHLQRQGRDITMSARPSTSTPAP